MVVSRLSIFYRFDIIGWGGDDTLSEPSISFIGKLSLQEVLQISAALHRLSLSVGSPPQLLMSHQLCDPWHITHLIAASLLTNASHQRWARMSSGRKLGPFVSHSVDGLYRYFKRGSSLLSFKFTSFEQGGALLISNSLTVLVGCMCFYI